MKVRTLLVAALMFFALSVAAFAQGTFNVGSTPVTAVINTGQTEKTGDLTFSVASIQPGGTVAGTITIAYPVPITSTMSTANNITGSGALAGATVNGASQNDNGAGQGILIINVPSGANVGEVLRVSGIRVAVANSGLTSLNVNISAVGNPITAGQTNNIQVISSITEGIDVTGTKATVSAVDGAITSGAAQLKVKEHFLNAFGLANEPSSYGNGGAGTGALMVRVTLDNPPPKDMTLKLPQTSGLFVATDALGAPLGAQPTFTSTSVAPLAAWYKLASSSDPALLETLTLDVTITPTAGKTFIDALPISATVTLAPIGTATYSATGLIPRYAVAEKGPIKLIDFTGANTWLIIPYAQVINDPATNLVYDTYVAIANTTVDPGEFATPQPGTLTFVFYPRKEASAAQGEPFIYTTGPNGPGTGDDKATGRVPPGSTWVGTLANVWLAAKAEDPTIPDFFSGYVFIQANFTNAHGIFAIYSAGPPVFTWGANILVTPRNGSDPEALNN